MNLPSGDLVEINHNFLQHLTVFVSGVVVASAPCPPHLWLRYVDDTFVVLHKYDIESFTTNINSLDPNIKFTIDLEKVGSIPFLDTEIILNDDATINTRVYRKPTHTDQYLNSLEIWAPGSRNTPQGREQSQQ